MIEKTIFVPKTIGKLQNTQTGWLLRRDPKDNATPTKVPPIVHEVLRSPGQPLSSSARAFMEPRFGHDFSQVRVHTDTQAIASAQAVNALAYTVGHHVVFSNRQYRPATSEGRYLLAHELAHVVQQGNRSSQSTLQRWSATVHANLTRQVITGAMSTFPDFQLDDTALQMLAFFAGDMDSKGEEMLFNVIGAFVGNQIATDVVGNIASESKEDDASYHHRKLVQHYRANTEHAFNHGEGGLYSIPEDQAEPLNQAHQERYELQANQTFQNIPRAFGSIQESELAKPALRQRVLTQLGDTLHIAQDRGAHREGGIGLGHDNLGISPDSPTANRIGYRKAQDLTKSVVERNRAILSLLLDRKFMRKHIAVQSVEEQSIHPQRKIDSSSGLAIGQIDDEYEREADRVATQIMNISMPVNQFEVSTTSYNHDIVRLTPVRASTIQPKPFGEITTDPAWKSKVQTAKHNHSELDVLTELFPGSAKSLTSQFPQLKFPICRYEDGNVVEGGVYYDPKLTDCGQVRIVQRQDERVTYIALGPDALSEGTPTFSEAVLYHEYLHYLQRTEHLHKDTLSKSTSPNLHGIHAEALAHAETFRSYFGRLRWQENKVQESGQPDEMSISLEAINQRYYASSQKVVRERVIDILMTVICEPSSREKLAFLEKLAEHLSIHPWLKTTEFREDLFKRINAKRTELTLKSRR